MAPYRKGRWSNPATILFGTELFGSERLFKFALLQAVRAHARLVIFHACDRPPTPPIQTYGMRRSYFEAAEETELQYLEILKHHASVAGVDCETIVRDGAAARLILECAEETGAERIVVGTNSPGPIGKAVLGSVTAEVLNYAHVPVCVVGPDAVDQNRTRHRHGKVLCATPLDQNCNGTATLAAEIAWQNETELLMLHVIKPHECAEMLARRGLDELERELVSMVHAELRRRVVIEPILVPGDVVEEILFQANTGRVELLVMGAAEDPLSAPQTAAPLVPPSRHGVVSRVLAHAPCPVLTLSPGALVLAAARSNPRNNRWFGMLADRAGAGGC
jgi:nucleotide-binding universal stress UspA family protein